MDDPACGTGGFFLATHDYVEHNYQLDKEQKLFLKNQTFKGTDIVDSVARLCAMNLLLHGIGSDKQVPVAVTDALAADPGQRFDVVLANPPFGKKSSTMIVGDDGKTSTEKDIIESYRQFWCMTLGPDSVQAASRCSSGGSSVTASPS